MNDDKKIIYRFMRNFLFSIRNIDSSDLCEFYVYDVNVSILFVAVRWNCGIEVREDSFYAIG